MTEPGGGMDRFWSKVRKTENCWLWTGAVTKAGYGLFWVGGPPGNTRRGATRKYAHRVAYELLVGPIPADKQIDHHHECPKNCINTDHLRLVSRKQQNENHAGPKVSSKSGVRGVYWHKSAQRWTAEVVHDGKKHYLGLFDELQEAEVAVLAKRRELHTHNDKDRGCAA